jgi:threonine synthase
MGIFSKKSGAHQWRGVIEEYRHRLPVSAKTPVVSLREGGTPLIYAYNLSELLGNNVWIKYEGLNPTGSFKDRGMTMAISKAAEDRNGKTCPSSNSWLNNFASKWKL